MKTRYSYSYYYDYVIQYDFVNAFHYKKPQDLPRLQKLTIAFKPLPMREFFCFFTFSRLLTSNPGTPKIKIKTFDSQKSKQKTVSASFELRKKQMTLFLIKMKREIFPTKKSRFKLNLNKLKTCETFNCHVNKLVSFNLMKNNYMLFKRLDINHQLHVNLITNAKRLEELVFLLRSYKLVQLQK